MQLPNSLLTFSFFWTTFLANVGGNTVTYGMDSKKTCTPSSTIMNYVEDGNSALVLGKQTQAENQATLKECKVRFKPLSMKGWDYLSLKFDNFYINDCGVTLTISQSPESTFQSDVSELVHLECEERNPRILYAKKDHTIEFKLARDDIFLRNYNFRVNVSLSQGPPRAGPSVALIIGIAAGLLAVIAIIAFILIKYIRLKNSVLRERRAERAIESALYIYSSQELVNPDVPPCTHVPGPETQNGANSHIGAHQNGSVNGRTPQDERQLLLTGHQNITPNNGHTPRSVSCDIIPPVYTSKDQLDVEGEMPPSYEEALEMPKPPDSPIYANA